MEMSGEQINEFKQQIIQQIESTFSEDKKGPAIERINAMNNEEFIDFLKKNSFKWAPSTGAWQRFNTPAGVQAVRDVLNFITKNEKINKISK